MTPINIHIGPLIGQFSPTQKILNEGRRIMNEWMEVEERMNKYV